LQFDTNKIVDGDTHILTPGKLAFRNTTRGFHPFRGTIDRIFSHTANGSIKVRTIGKGKVDGFLAKTRDAANEIIGPALFQSQNGACSVHVGS